MFRMRPTEACVLFPSIQHMYKKRSRDWHAFLSACHGNKIHALMSAVRERKQGESRTAVIEQWKWSKEGTGDIGFRRDLCVRLEFSCVSPGGKMANFWFWECSWALRESIRLNKEENVSLLSMLLSIFVSGIQSLFGAAGEGKTFPITSSNTAAAPIGAFGCKGAESRCWPSIQGDANPSDTTGFYTSSGHGCSEVRGWHEDTISLLPHILI